MASALENIKTNMAAANAKAAEPSLLDKALSFFGIGGESKPAVPNGTAFQNIQSKLGTAPKFESAPSSSPVKFDASKIPTTPPIFSSDFGVKPVVVQNAPATTFSDIFKKSADIITAIPKSIIESEFNPSPQELELEKAFQTKPDASTYTKVTEYLPNLAAKGIFRFFQPIFQPYADDLSQAIVSKEFAPMVASGQIPYSEFQKIFPALDKSNSQVIGDSIQAGLATFMPNIFAEGAASAAGTGFKSALVQGLKTGAASGGIFGTAQVLSSGTTDPAEIADIYAKNIIGGGILGAITHSTIPLSREAMSKVTKDVTEKFGLPTEVFIDPAKVREVLKPSGKTVEGVKPKVSPAEADLVRSLGMTEEQYQKAANEGVTVSVPATKVIQITDKPYFSDIKDTFGFKPTDKTITIKGEPHVKTIGREAPKPEVTPEVSRETAVAPENQPPKAPDVVKTETAPEQAPATSYEVKQGRGETPSRVTIVIKSEDGIKAPVARVAEALGGKFVNRDGGYNLPIERRALFEQAVRAVEAGKIEAPPVLATPKEKSAFRKQFTEYTKNNPEPTIAPEKKQVPADTGKEKKTSGVAKSIEAEAVKKGLTEGFKDLAGYDPVTVERQAELVSDMISKDINRVKRIVSGKEDLPEEIRGAMFVAGIEKYAQETGDVKLLQDLASSPIVAETSRHAQELRLLQEREPESPVNLIRQVKKAREAAAEKSAGQPINKAKTAIAENIKAEIKKKAPTRQSWEDFVKSIEC